MRPVTPTKDLVTARVAQITGGQTLGDAGVDQAVLTELLRIFEATGGRIYTLNLATGHYVGTAQDQRSRRPASFDARRLRTRSGWGMLEAAAGSRVAQVLNTPSTWDSETGRHEYGSRMVLPVLRGRTVVALVDIHHDRPKAFERWTGSSLAQAELGLQQLANAYEARSVHRILERTANFKISLREQQQEALHSLVEFVGQTSGMQYVELRRLEPDGSLECVGAHGFPADTDLEALSLTGVEDTFLPFAAVVQDRTDWVAADLTEPVYDGLRRHGELRDIRSFVACPVVLGTELWGTVSFAAAVEFEFSSLEVYALRALANLTGVALSATQAADDAAEARFDDGRLMQAVLSNEVVVATRHEMYDQLEVVGNARSALDDITRSLADPRKSSRLTRKDIDFLEFQARCLDDAWLQMNKILDTIRFAQSDLKEAADRVPVAEIWQRAVEAFSFRIRRAKVARTTCDIPTSLAIVGSADWLRIVFMHLFLNSLDAFEREHEKGKREIVIGVHERRGGVVRLRYYDNGGGIWPSTLKRGGVPLDGDPRRLVFERYVSSKSRGTGLGLASCRAALDTMGGSIDLVDWRRGATFDITLNEWHGD